MINITGMIRTVIVLVVFWTVLDGKLIKLPTNVYVFTGETAWLNCSTDADQTPADWRFRQYGSQQTDTIYEAGFLQSSSRLRHTMIKGNGSYDFIISNVRPEDAGTYICIDLAGMGERAQAELIVIESNPSCESNITSTEGVLVDNSCHLNPDYMEYKCRVKYKGNVAPVLEWRNMGMLTPINSTTIQLSGNRSNELFAINTFVVKSTWDLNGTYFECQILNFRPANEENKTCTTSVTSILYAVNSSKTEEREEKREVQCSVDTNIRNCKVFWKASSQKQEVHVLDQSIIHFNETVIDEKATNYECLGECKVSGQICTIRGILIKLIPDEPQNVSSVNTLDLRTLILIVLLCVSVTIIVSLLIFILTRSKRKRNNIVTVANKCICCTVKERYDERKSKLRIKAFDVEFHSKFKRDVEFLGDVFDAEHGLISSLLNKGLLTPKEIRDIYEPPPLETNRTLILKLLEYLPPKFECEPTNIELFLEALKETKQQHVAGYLANEAGGFCRPMTDDELHMIDKNLPVLTQLIEVDEKFLKQLVTKGCITKTHMRKIMECYTNMERNTKLLTILKRRSYRNFLQFKKCLRRTKQRGINDLLEKTDFDDKQNISYTPDGKYQAFPDITASPRNRFTALCSKDVGVQTQTECYDIDDTPTEFESKLMPAELDESSSRIELTPLSEFNEHDTDTNENYDIEKSIESFADELDNGAALPTSKSAHQHNIHVDIHEVHSCAHKSNAEITTHPLLAEEECDDEIFDECSKNQNGSTQGPTQMRNDFQFDLEQSKKTKHVVIIFAKSRLSLPSYPSELEPEPDAQTLHSESDAPEPEQISNFDVVWQDVNKICSDNRQCCSLEECTTQEELNTTLKSSFDNVGKTSATVVFVFTGDGSRDGLILMNDQPYKLDNILRNISEFHSSSLKKGHLPNHVTVMFVCSYGHCYTEKKFTTAMNVIKYTDRSKPEIDTNICKHVLSTIFPKQQTRENTKRQQVSNCVII